MAGSTGFEPATSGLTVQCANQAAPRARLETSARYTTLPSDASGRCALNCFRQLPSDVLQVRRVHDVVAVEHRARPVPRGPTINPAAYTPLNLLAERGTSPPRSISEASGSACACRVSRNSCRPSNVPEKGCVT